MKKPKLSKPALNTFLSLLAATGVLFGIFLFTDPDAVPLAVLLVPFILIGYLCHVLVSTLIRLHPGMRASKGALRRFIPLAFAFLVVVFLLLASLGQLTVRDGLLVIGFIAFLTFYVARADFLK